MKSQSILIVDKGGSIKSHVVKEFAVEDLYKKCGFKKADGFALQTEWNRVKVNGKTYRVQLYGKLDGKATTENKYDFPPPMDSKLLFGSCALVGLEVVPTMPTKYQYCNLTVDLWDKIYDKLFGGFEDLKSSLQEDEDEEDELDHVPKHMKTKHGGYLKDDFVVDSSDAEEETNGSSEEEEDEDDEENQEGTNDNENENDLELSDVGSELSEESYDSD